MWRQPPIGYTDVGRRTPWGNPFRIGTTLRTGEYLASAGSTLPHFERYLLKRLEEDPSFLLPLRGKKLWCPGCGIDSPTCHARILEKYLK